MRKALFLTIVAMLAVALVAPSGAVASPAPTPGVQRTQALAPDAIGIQDVAVCYQVRTAGGWGDVKCGVNGAAGPAAGCFGCELEFISAAATPGVSYRIRTAGGWGSWKFDGEAAGCFGCTIQAMQLVTGCCNLVVEYRVRTPNGWGSWRANGDTAGCVGCTVEAIQMRILFTV